jgi:diacylglycerol kinase family enzyme
MTVASGPVGLISNPQSGHNRDQFQRIRQRIERCGSIHHIVTENPGDIPDALAQLARENIGILAINGGDGTTSAILGHALESGCFDSLPLVALLPGGTANMNAGDIGISGSLARATERFCRWCDGDRDTTGRIAGRSLLRVVPIPGEPPQFGMFLGAGAIIQGTEYAHEEVHARGLRDDFSLALTTLRTVWGILRDNPRFNRHVTTRMTIDNGAPMQHDALILAISTLQRLAFGMKPFWGNGPGRLRITLIEQHSSRFARTFLSIVRGRPNRNAVPAAGYHSHNAQTVELRLDGKLNLDGEILEPAGPVSISASEELAFLRL